MSIAPNTSSSGSQCNSFAKLPAAKQKKTATVISKKAFVLFFSATTAFCVPSLFGTGKSFESSHFNSPEAFDSRPVSMAPLKTNNAKSALLFESAALISAEFSMPISRAQKIIVLADSLQAISSRSAKSALPGKISARSTVEKALLMDKDGVLEGYIDNLYDVMDALMLTGYDDAAKVVGIYIEMLTLASGKY